MDRRILSDLEHILICYGHVGSKKVNMSPNKMNHIHLEIDLNEDLIRTRRNNRQRNDSNVI